MLNSVGAEIGGRWVQRQDWREGRGWTIQGLHVMLGKLDFNYVLENGTDSLEP